MPTLRPDSIFQEWLFSPEEAIQARLLTPLQIQRLNTLYAEITKAQANSIIPAESLEDRAFLLNVMSNAGKLELITQLFQDHADAIREMSARATNQVGSTSPLSEIDTTEQRANLQVHVSS